MYLQNQSATCLRCERGFVLANSGQCVVNTVTSSRVTLGANTYGCASDYGAYSIGILDYDKRQQICRYTWLLPPFSIHLAFAILVVCSIVGLIYFTINPVKKGPRFNQPAYQPQGQFQGYQPQPGDNYQNLGNADQTIETSPEARDSDSQRDNEGDGDLQLSLENTTNLKSE